MKKYFLIYLMIQGFFLHSENLSPCPLKRNCVCSCSDSPIYYIAPFDLQGDLMVSMQKLQRALLDFPRVRLIKVAENYIHAEFTSLIFRFVVDVEFLYNPLKNVIDVRSASRVGYSDLGVNRSRVEKIRSKYLKYEFE
jgi:uncharacterized protein (DUF1499 family)